MNGGPDPAIARVRSAVRKYFTDGARHAYLAGGELYVAVSGGADSLALTEACVYFGRTKKVRIHALIVDHGLQAESTRVAREAAQVCRQLGVGTATVLSAQVGRTGGPEAAARKARYNALRTALPSNDQCLVALGHTQDDQAETVLLGLGRGSGARSIAGMRPLDPPWARPLLGVPRATTRDACAALGIQPWQDPHNVDPRFTRVRLRTEVLPLLEEVLSGGVAAALARTATQLREDNEALDLLADELLHKAKHAALTMPEQSAPIGEPPLGLPLPALAVDTLKLGPPALRRRALRRWLRKGGVPELTDGHLRSVDALVAEWRGQGGVWLPGNLVVERAHGRLWLNSGLNSGSTCRKRPQVD